MSKIACLSLFSCSQEYVVWQKAHCFSNYRKRESGEGGRVRKAGRKEGRKGRERHSAKRSYILMF